MPNRLEGRRRGPQAAVHAAQGRVGEEPAFGAGSCWRVLRCGPALCLLPGSAPQPPGGSRPCPLAPSAGNPCGWPAGWPFPQGTLALETFWRAEAGWVLTKPVPFPQGAAPTAGEDAGLRRGQGVVRGTMTHALQSWPTNSSLLQSLLGQVTELKILSQVRGGATG